MQTPPIAFENLALEVNGFVFDALAAGPQTGALVLFLHGFPEFADAWTAIMRPVAEAGYRAVAVDQRGYSPRARPPLVKDYATDRLIADALGFADSLGAPRFHLVGHDWGGLLAWKIAAEHNERLLTLTVVSTPHIDAFLNARATDPDQKRKSWYIHLFRFPGRVAELMLLAWNARFLRGAYAGALTPAQVEANVRRLKAPGALTATLNWYRAADFEHRIGRIKTPTLFIWGAKDQALGPVAAKATADYVEGPYRFEALKDGSHWLLEAAPEVVSSLLLDHLASAGRGQTKKDDDRKERTSKLWNWGPFRKGRGGRDKLV